MQTITKPNSFLYNNLAIAERYFNKFRPDDNDVLNQERLQSIKDLFKKISSQNCVFVLVWDMVKDCFVCAVDERKVVGYDISLYLADDGIQFSLSKMHPEFITSFFIIQNTALEYIIQYTGAELNKIVINFDGRYKKANGDYFHFLQQTICIETDHIGNPLLFLAYIYDITHLKKWHSSNLVISTPDGIEMSNFNFDAKCLEPVHPLSKREKKVLCYLAQGKTSKEIASELFISPHTVDTHRRNLLERTNCLNTTGLVTYAKLVGLL
jgi:DNA-binding CsgD family transcriptional regulator